MAPAVSAIVPHSHARAPDASAATAAPGGPGGAGSHQVQDEERDGTGQWQQGHRGQAQEQGPANPRPSRPGGWRSGGGTGHQGNLHARTIPLADTPQTDTTAGDLTRSAPRPAPVNASGPIRPPGVRDGPGAGRLGTWTTRGTTIKRTRRPIRTRG